MDDTRPSLAKNPERRANFLSKIFFCFVFPFLRRGYKHKLDTEDLFEHLPEDESELLHKELQSAWQEELETYSKETKCNGADETLTKPPPSPSLMRAIRKTFGTKFFMFGMLLFLEECVRLVQPIFIGGVIKYFRYDHPYTTEEAYMYAGGLSLCAAIYPIIHHPYFYGIQKIGMRIKVATSSLIFDKALRLSSSALHKTTVGHVINLLSTDVGRYDFATIFFHYTWVSPFMLIGYAVLLWRELGVSCLAGFGAMIMLIPLQGYFSRKMGACRREVAARADTRIGVMSEILNGIRVIKMYAWEGAFANVVYELRNNELKAVKMFATYQSLVLGTFWASGRLVVLFAVGAYLLAGYELSAEKVFVAAALFNSCRLPLTLFLPLGLQFFYEAKVSTMRIQKFLELDEHVSADSGEIKAKPDASPESKEQKLPVVDPCIEMEHFSAKWETDQTTPTINDITFSAKRGNLIAIIGAVGSGKSTILSSILGETKQDSGHLLVRGRVAYVPQEAWVFGATLRQNITFGAKYDEAAYQRTIKDISSMPNGDQTYVGDRGVVLSGGQKARINFARAVYRDADIYVMDDPLSAVDAAVARYLFEKCIRTTLRDKVCVLVTHQLQYLHQADNVLLIRDGTCIASGTLTQLQNEHPTEFAEIMAESEATARREKEAAIKTAHVRSTVSQTSRSEGKAMKRAISHTSTNRGTSDRKSSAESEKLLKEPDEQHMENIVPLELSESLSESAWSLALGKANDNITDDKANITQNEEERSIGAVTWRVYAQYVLQMAPNIYLLIALFIFVVFVQAVMNVSDWTTAAEYQRSQNDTETATPPVSPNTTNTTQTKWSNNIDQSTYIYIYSSLCITLMILGVLRVLCFRLAELRASAQLHAQMFNSVVHTSVAFFDSNPVGRVLNRFSKDTGTMDESLAFVFYDFVQGAMNFFSIVLIVGLLNPFVFVPTIPLALLFFALRSFYLRTSREVKRLEAITRSPVFSHVSATLNGLSAIRAFGAQSHVMRNFHEAQNVYTSAFALTLLSARWLAVVIDWLVVIYISFVAFICVAAGPERINSGAVGLALFYSLDMARSISRFMEIWTRCEVEMVSVERILGYGNLPPETPVPALVKVSTKHEKHAAVEMKYEVPKDWPKEGHIEMKQLCLSYGVDANSPLTLKHITCDIPATFKIGVVGRTGAGKSSLLRALFRLTEPTGQLLIDGVDIQNVPLERLRKSISIIPQDPVLFIGTLRKNLDPFDEFSDGALWSALDHVQLQKAFTDTMPNGLQTSMQEGGANLSVGQKQLVCLARALLRHCKILVIDEATANVDQQTDALIQRTLRTQFDKCTVLTIAHRLNTIMDSDKVMVLNCGELVEFESPHELLLNEQTLFTQLAKETGPSNLEILKRLASDAYNSRQNKPPIVDNVNDD